MGVQGLLNGLAYSFDLSVCWDPALLHCQCVLEVINSIRFMQFSVQCLFSFSLARIFEAT